MEEDLFYVNNLGETPKMAGDGTEAEVRNKLGLGPKARVTRKHWDEYFEKMSDEAHTPEERAVVKAWTRLTGATDGLFRVQGRIRAAPGGERISEITLTTEVKERAIRQKYWNRLYDFALYADARIEWEYTAKELEHSWKCDKKGKKIEGSDVYGPDHGKLFRQVGIVWSFPLGVTLRTLKVVIREMKREMEKRELGVNWINVI